MQPSNRQSHWAISVKLPQRWVAIAAAAFLGLSGAAVWQVWQVWRLRIAQAEAAQTAIEPLKISTVTALGRLTPQGETIALIAPTATQESRVEQLLVEEGDRVQADQLIAVLDSRDRLQAALQQAKEQVKIARAQLDQVKAGAKTGELQAQQAEISRLESAQAGDINAKQATIGRLAAEVENAQTEYQRYESLYQRGAISASARDAKQLTYTTTQRQLQEAEAELARIQTTSQQQIRQAQATLDSLGEVRPVDISAAEAQVQAAIATVAEAQANLDQAEVRSPRAGQIIEIHTRPGEKVSDQGIATLGETDQMIVVAEIYQEDIGKIEPGQSAEITTPVVANTLQGTVERIGLHVEQQQVVNEDPAANIDAKVVEVHIQLTPESSQQVSGLTNLQVTTTIKLE
ncbi:MAG: ABC exporter membrane fusion protein [Phormidesmis sp.]